MYLKIAWPNVVLKICKNVIQKDINNLAKFHVNDHKIICDLIIWNIWLYLDSSAIFQIKNIDWTKICTANLTLSKFQKENSDTFKNWRLHNSTIKKCSLYSKRNVGNEPIFNGLSTKKE